VRGEIIAGRNVLLRIRRIQGVHCRSEHRMAPEMPAPFIEGQPPGVRAVIAAKGDEPLGARGEAEERAVPRTHWAIGSLHTAMKEDALAEDKITIRRPRQVVEGM